MGENQKKDESACKVGPSGAPSCKTPNNRTLLICCVCALAVVAGYSWYQSSNDQGLDIAEVTRPPEGFDAPIGDDELLAVVEDAVEQDDEPAYISATKHVETDHKPNHSPSGSPEKDQTTAEVVVLQDKVGELEQLLKDKDSLIVELTRQLADAKLDDRVPTEDESAGHPEHVPASIEPESVKPPEGSDQSSTKPTSEVRTHTVNKGETLSEISRLYYGSPNRWQKIVDANQDKISDKNRVRAGMVLVIPE